MPTPNNKPFPFKIGADPEFNILLHNKRLSAKQLFEQMLNNKKEWKKDRNEMGYTFADAGNIGWDGASATGEIRPTPNNLPEQVISNLGEMFSAISKISPIFELNTLSNKAPVGGHIHLEIPMDWTEQKMQKMHKQLCSFYIPLLLGEDSVNLRIRTSENYGRISDYRVETFKQQDNSTSKTYEFRVPSAEWLTTPKTALGTLAYLAVIFNEIMNNPKNLKLSKEIIIRNQEQAEALHSLSITNFVFLTKILLNKIKRTVKTFEFYPQYKKEIDFILNPAAVMKEKQHAQFNIINGWKLNQKTHFTKRDLLNDKKLKANTLEIDLDSLSSAVYLQYNDDEFVSEFVRAIKHRVLAFNWKLKNNYFFFGLRKGLKDFMVFNKNFQMLKGIESVKTVKDLECIKHVFDKMNSKFYLDNSGSSRSSDAIINKRHILIGIPYPERVARNFKSIIEIVYDIDKGRIKPLDINSSQLFDDESISANETEAGEIYKICMLQEQQTVNAQLSPNENIQEQRHEENTRRITEQVARENEE